MAGTRKKPSPSGRYQGFFVDHAGKKRYFTGSKRRSETLQIARKLEEDHRQIRLGYREPRPKHFKYQQRSFMETVGEYIEWGKLQGGLEGRPWSRFHAPKKRHHLCLWAETLDLKVLGDLDNILPRVEATLRELAKLARAGKTIANIAEALVSFCNWCVIRGYLSKNPLAKLGRMDTTPKEEYRALRLDEIYHLLKVAPDHLKMLYIIAMTTGLRVNELRSLTRRHLDMKNGGLLLDAAWTKNRKPRLQPLPERLLRQLDLFCGSGLVQTLYQRFCRNFTCPKDALLYVPSHPARQLDKDLKAAGIPKHTDDGKVAFHALRTCFVTLAYEAGATHLEAKELARHSNPKLTANTYGRTRNERLAKLTETVADRVLLGQAGANMVHETELAGSVKRANLRSAQQLTDEPGEYRQGVRIPPPPFLRIGYKLLFWQQLNNFCRDIRFGFMHRIRTYLAEKHPVSDRFSHFSETLVPGSTVGVGSQRRRRVPSQFLGFLMGSSGLVCESDKASPQSVKRYLAFVCVFWYPGGFQILVKFSCRMTRHVEKRILWKDEI